MVRRLLVLLALASVVSTAAPAAKSKKAASGTTPEAEKPWKVEEPHGPVTSVAFDTDEATWLHLDLSPDGRRIVFSLLGDLYLLPAEGGAATRITSGPAYDVEPRFSPDGTRIAFASDRGGLENLWTCDLEGKDARQVSTEKASTVSAPAWTPDGRWLLGRKRLTDGSSLGTVELWTWHVRGGEGVQVTKRDEQPDAADPVVSADGRYVYFSARDSRYRYDRNINEGIWQIKRLDLRTGQMIPLTGEFGGAAAPRLSPDGKRMAFVRRVRTKTRLEIMDLDSGKTRLVSDALERDLQQGFAFHGVFPGYAWTPDGRSILASVDGRIAKIDADSGARTPVPFTARVEQSVAEAVRQKHAAVADTVRAKVIRWPVESPDGKRLVFSALGHLYTMELPAGKPRRLTGATDFEYAPAFSPDGSTIVFTTWNDRDGGHVWTIDASAPGAAPKRVTRVPGQYVNPSFAPDGSKIVFLAGSGATFRDESPGDELWHEVRWVDAAGGDAHPVIGTRNRGSNRRMARPMFTADGARIVFVEDEPASRPADPPKTVLVSVKLDGTDRRAHLRWTRGEEAVISPDGKWVVFNEQYNAWLTAMPPLEAQTVDVGLEGGALPVAQLTDEGGEWVNWAGNGKTVTWIYGPVYRRLDLDRAFPAPAKPEDGKAAAPADKKKAMPPSTPIEIVLEVPRARPDGVTAYSGARLVTMKGDQVIERGTIVVDRDRIVAVGKDGEVAIPAGASRVDLTGKTVIPGLIDEHAHLHYSALDILPNQPWKYSANLAYGITTTHDPSASNHEVFGQGEMVEAGLMHGPRIFSTGFILYGADDPGRAFVNSLDDARRHLRRLKTLGAFSVKSYMQPKREARQWIIQAAREEGMLVVPEGGGDLESDMTMVLDGHTTIEHALPVTPLRKDVVTLLAKSGTAYTPTLLVAYGGLSGDRWFHQHLEIWKDPRLTRFVPQGILDTLGRIRSVMATDEDWHHLDVAASAKKVLDAGGRVCLGGHGQMQGAGPHWELRAFVQGGMTPLQALRVGTLFPAETLGLGADLGSIEPGKLADFVVLDENPLEAIENSETVGLVVKNGKAYRPEALALPR